MKKIFDELNRYSLTFKNTYPWNISCICRYVLSNLLFFFMFIKGIKDQSFLLDIIFFTYSLTTLLPILFVLRR